MKPKELMEQLFGKDSPYPGMAVEWQCYAGKDALESGIYKGTISSIVWCRHCGLPTFHVESEHGAHFEVDLMSDGRFVCGKEAPSNQ
jgi:hypothetical protein